MSYVKAAQYHQEHPAKGDSVEALRHTVALLHCASVVLNSIGEYALRIAACEQHGFTVSIFMASFLCL